MTSTNRLNVLIIDDEKKILGDLKDYLHIKGHRVFDACDAASARLRFFEADVPLDLILCDWRLPDSDGVRLVRELLSCPRGTHTTAILLTGEASRFCQYPPNAGPALGDRIKQLIDEAFAFGRIFHSVLQKPLTQEKILEALAAVQPTIDRHRSARRRMETMEALVRDMSFDSVDAASTTVAVKQMLGLANRVSKGMSDVLLHGAPHTGRGRMAKRIHDLTLSAQGSYAVLRCAALSEDLLESELQGRRSTGDVTTIEGTISRSRGGTCYLADVDRLSETGQLLILRALKNLRISSDGSSPPKEATCRIIASMSQPLDARAKQRMWNPELDELLRRSVVIDVPPLRARRGDIPRIANLVYARLNKANDVGTATGISPEALSCLFDYEWPENILDLERVIKNAAYACDNSLITPEVIQVYLGPKVSKGESDEPLPDLLQQEREEVQERYRQFRKMNQQIQDKCPHRVIANIFTTAQASHAGLANCIKSKSSLRLWEVLGEQEAERLLGHALQYIMKRHATGLQNKIDQIPVWMKDRMQRTKKNQTRTMVVAGASM